MGVESGEWGSEWSGVSVEVEWGLEWVGVEWGSEWNGVVMGVLVGYTMNRNGVGIVVRIGNIGVGIIVGE